jgi:hypothetical protein
VAAASWAHKRLSTFYCGHDSKFIAHLNCSTHINNCRTSKVPNTSNHRTTYSWSTSAILTNLPQKIQYLSNRSTKIMPDQSATKSYPLLETLHTAWLEEEKDRWIEGGFMTRKDCGLIPSYYGWGKALL